MTTFTETVWAKTSSLRARIRNHPFNQGIADGSLPSEVFEHYVLQDALYLDGYARALAACAAQAPDADTVSVFAASASGAIAVERQLHAGFFETLGVSQARVAETEASPTCLAYTSYLLGLAHAGGFPALVAGILPCFWVYWEVGQDIASRTHRENPYRAWIDTYSDPTFGESVKRVIGITDEAARVNPHRVPSMETAFVRSTQYEWMFWDAAWRREDWPVGL